MSGHNKFSKIKHKKAATDKLKAQNFSKVVKLIQIAARKGSADPTMNPELRLALEKAKEVNMPKENIHRILEKASNTNGQVIMYEGFGPEGVGLLIKTYTDNANRTVADLRHLLSKNGGSLGASGSVIWMFEEIIREQEYKVNIPTEITPESKEKLNILVEILEELDDVEIIWNNTSV
ncbi:MAG: YebC/PmpR family DNA-binding transcriptional regulator [Candidatus Paceibacterota bacterium]